jgi:hypothetical protein
MLRLVPLSDGAGEVMEVGAGVTRVKVGDKVAGCFFQRWSGGRPPPNVQANALGGSIDGMLAEYVVLEEDGVVKIPAHLSVDEGATLPCAGGVKFGRKPKLTAHLQPRLDAEPCLRRHQRVCCSFHAAAGAGCRAENRRMNDGPRSPPSMSAIPPKAGMMLRCGI